MTHTPGPWVTSRFGGKTVYRDVSNPSHPKNKIAVCNTANNARLIAAAPKMLAALLACREYWRDTDIPCRIDLHDQVTDAIFAATGEHTPHQSGGAAE